MVYPYYEAVSNNWIRAQEVGKGQSLAFPVLWGDVVAVALLPGTLIGVHASLQGCDRLRPAPQRRWVWFNRESAMETLAQLPKNAIAYALFGCSPILRDLGPPDPIQCLPEASYAAWERDAAFGGHVLSLGMNGAVPLRLGHGAGFYATSAEQDGIQVRFLGKDGPPPSADLKDW